MNSISSYSENAGTTSDPNPIIPDPNVTEIDDVWAHVPRQMPTASDKELLLHGNFPSQQQVRVIMSQLALQQVQEHARSDLGQEVGGALLGHVVRYQAQTFVEVLQAMPAPSADHGPIHFTFTADTWAYINQTREAQFADLEIVGWFHTHPNLTVFYSSDDVLVHSAAFTLPWQIGLVVDPILEELCFFGWENSANNREIMPIAGFYEWLDHEEESRLDWQVRHHQHGGIPARMALSPYQDGLFAGLPAVDPWWGVLLGGASLFVSLLTLIYLILKF